ncbi:quercetin dioxygenase-like cupin family protein [Streptomyces sp. V4I23]|uniref:cupin domain-containing protein n=1 Tax=Streptomyces sp. V4I23 TaxID=3042282 RepID=UPI00277F5EDB|nr:cupin domain-containing protein [Streptomyces sp. V4I23]MDQ1006430.1 quercetin dioxygenase-like cupin family protein [Streptomyces sp. V4I23]
MGGSGLPGADAVQAAALLECGGDIEALAAFGEVVGDGGAVLDGLVVVVLELGPYVGDFQAQAADAGQHPAVRGLLADTLGVSVSALMEGPSEGRVRIVTADATMPLWTGSRGSEARLMLTTPGPAPVEVWRWKLEPGEEYPSHPHQPGVVETVSVTSGRMTLVVDGTEHPVEAGQTAAFDGDAPHTYRGSGDETCHLIMTVHLLPGPAGTA